jgi:hypothetical protein
MWILLSPWRGNFLAVAYEHYATGGQNFVDFRVYHIDISVPTMKLLNTFTRPDHSIDSHFKDGMLAVGWEENGYFMCCIRQLFFSKDEAEAEVVMNLGSEMLAWGSPVINMICNHMFIASVSSKLFLYAIPDLQPVREYCATRPIYATPFSVYDSKSQDNKPIWNELCSHHEGKRSVSAESDEGGSRLIVLPETGQPEPTFVIQSREYRDMGPSRAISVAPSADDDLAMIELQISTHFTKPDRHPGYMRLGRSKAPDPSHIVSIDIPTNYVPEIENLSWDEESGRICLLLSKVPRSKYLMIVDLL